MSLAVVGNLTLDELDRDGKLVVRPGGSALFTSLAAASLGAKVSIVSNIGRDYPESILSSLTKSKIDTSEVRRNQEETTRFRISYTAGSRRLDLVHPGKNIRPSKAWKIFDLIHLGPVFNEIGIDALSTARHRCNFLSVDVQGLLRTTTRRGHVQLQKRKIDQFLSKCNLVKATAEETRIVAPGKSLVASAKQFIRRGADFALITQGRSGALLATRDDIVLKIPSVPERQEIDMTGAGDVFVGSWLKTYLTTNDMFWSSAVAAAFASISVRSLGLDKFRFRRKELLRRADWAYKNSQLVRA